MHISPRMTIIYSERLFFINTFNPQSVAHIRTVFDLLRQKKKSLTLSFSTQKQIFMTNFSQLGEFGDRAEDFYRGPVKAWTVGHFMGQ